jgi:hypothetical protein
MSKQDTGYDNAVGRLPRRCASLRSVLTQTARTFWAFIRRKQRGVWLVPGHGRDQPAESVARRPGVSVSRLGPSDGSAVTSLGLVSHGVPLCLRSASTSGRSGPDDFRTDAGQPRMRESSSPRISSGVTVWSISAEKKVRRKLRPRLRISSSVHPGSTCRSGGST